MAARLRVFTEAYGDSLTLPEYLASRFDLLDPLTAADGTSLGLIAILSLVVWGLSLLDRPPSNAPGSVFAAAEDSAS